MSLYLKQSPGITNRDKRRRRLETLNPDGVPIDVAWSEFEVGASVFIPAINTTKLLTQLKAVAQYHRWTIQHRIHSEGGKWGVRVWRVL